MIETSQVALVYIPARDQVRPVDGPDVHVLGQDSGARIRTQAHEVTDQRREDAVRAAADIAERHICDVELTLQ